MILLGVVCFCSLWAGYQLLLSSGTLARFGAGGDDERFPGDGQRLGGAARTAKHKRSWGIAS